MGKLEELRKIKEEYDAQVSKLGKEAVMEAIDEFLKQHQEVKKLAMLCYTPYFQDGDPCYFGLQRVCMDLGDAKSKDSIWDWPDKYSDNLDKKLIEDFKKLETLLSDSGDILESAFGDHVKIVITNDTERTTEIEEWEHD